jgi:2-polyprenyl-6-methoxyphenol hydroxylase-like FAD-dependent oxidoreductase
LHLPHFFASIRRNRQPQRREHAIVIGGSMAGLLAARVLADHVEQVTIIDRDRFPAEPVFRPGTPQARHTHVLLLRGQQILETLFPGLKAELADAGVPMFDWCADMARHGPHGWALRFPSDFQVYSCSRHLLEWSIRRRLARHPAVHFREACRVTDLLMDESGSQVLGVKLVERSPEAARAGTTLAADMVIDASGRDSRAPQWLANHGYAAPTETVIDSKVGYATRYYRIDPSQATNLKGLGIYTQTRGSGFLEIEGSRWSVTLTGFGQDAPPSDEAGFQAFIHKFERTELVSALQHAQPISPIYGYRRTENRWRHYERLDRRPENFLILGDAVCALNPTYGQGLTAAALAALDLDHCLRQGSFNNPALRFQRRLARSLRAPWLMATSADSQAMGSHTSQSLASRLMHRYIDQLYGLTRRNRRVALARYRVMHLLAPPISLLSPAVALPVIHHWLWSSLIPFRFSGRLRGSETKMKS